MPKLRPLLLYWLPLLVWTLIIFSASSDQQSFQHSSRILGPLLRWMFPSLTPAAEDELVFFCRKCAHFLEYAFLGVLAWRALKNAQSSSSAWSRRPMISALGVVFLYAISDEVHQAFVPTRQASTADVLIDTLGGGAGLVLIWVTHLVFHVFGSGLPQNSPSF